MTEPTLRRMPDVLRARARLEPDRLAHDDTRRTLTFAQWDREGDEIGGGLAAGGVRPGDRVLLPVTNTHAVGLATAYVGVHRAGGICVPLGTRIGTEEAARFARHVEARWAVTDVPELLSSCELAAVWPVGDVPRDTSALPDQDALPGPDADADILPTSGTTGRPKGVVASHAELVQSLGDGTGTSPIARILHAVPFTGYGGLHGIMLNPIRTGTAVITQPRFDPAGFLRLAADREVDALQVVPAMLRLLLDCEELGDHDLSRVRWILVGTAPLPPDFVTRVETTWPDARVVNLYGSTEAGTAGGTQLSPRRSRDKPGSVGRPAAGTEVEIRADDGARLPQGAEGEIWVRSSAPPRRYWNDPVATAATWEDGWLRTGDVGVLDEDGDLTITGRKKEIVIRGGYNISPVEIEDVLHAHADVADAAVVGVPHEVLGEDVVAFVTARAGAELDVAELGAWAAHRLADYKVPRRIEVLDELPRNAMGKVVKAKLVE